MSAIISPMVEKLTTLADVVPLTTPLAVTISIGNVCDFKCSYCIIGDTLENSHIKRHMTTLTEFEQIISQLQEFEQPIRQISLVSHGETILNHELPEMIRQIKKKSGSKSKNYYKCQCAYKRIFRSSFRCGI